MKNKEKKGKGKEENFKLYSEVEHKLYAAYGVYVPPQRKRRYRKSIKGTFDTSTESARKKLAELLKEQD